MIIGIDLGTTFSVIAVEGVVRLTDGYPAPRFLEQCNVSVIPDEFGNLLIPSAVWEDPEEPGKLVVGALARDARDEGYSPIILSKRNIGTDIPHPLGDRHLTAREVAREILAYLKGIAEEALGKRIERAVITHPAYFNDAMREETALAAQDAGFLFEPKMHLLEEPRAAALAYFRGDCRDPLRVLAYDLGGGTFDVTVMERRGANIRMKAFGGNHLLGGFNFDRELTYWLLEQLRKRADITLKEDSPEDQVKWARLLRVAEQSKHKLADAPTDKMPVQMRRQDIFKDDHGRPIHLLEQIDRKDFVALIQDLLDETIYGQGGPPETKGCNAVLATAGWTIDQIDEILLVGGSTWGPWVTQTIKRAWGREAQRFEPDLGVAAGAAIAAATLPPDGPGGTTCKVVLDTRPRSVLTSVNVAGRVLPVGVPTLPPGLQVVLRSQLGMTLGPVEPNADGDFVFEKVELQPLAATRFDLSLVDGEGRQVLEHRFEITHAEEADPEIFQVLPKPLFVEVVGGLKRLVDEGEILPAHCEVQLARANEIGTTIEIILFQDEDRPEHAVGSVVIRDVPREAPIGAKVNLVLDIDHNRITGRAAVFTRKGAVAVEVPVDIVFHVPKIPGTSELKAEFEQLKLDLPERIDVEHDAERRMTLQAQGIRLSRKIAKLLDDPSPHSRQEAYLRLRELSRLVHHREEAMDPPLDGFERLLDRVRVILSGRADDPIIQGHVRTVDRLEAEGHAAYARKDHRTWGQVNVSLQQLLRRLIEGGGGGEHVGPIPSSYQQKRHLSNELDQARQELRSMEVELRQKKLLERRQEAVKRLHEDIDAIEKEIEGIDGTLDGETMLPRTQEILSQRIEPVRREIKRLPEPDTEWRGARGTGDLV